MKKLKPKWIVLMSLPLLIPGAALLRNRAVPVQPVAVPPPEPDVRIRIKFEPKRNTNELRYMLRQLSAQLKAHPGANRFVLEQSVFRYDGTSGEDIEMRYDRATRKLIHRSYAFTWHIWVFEHPTEEDIQAASTAISHPHIFDIFRQRGVRYKLNA